MTATARGSRSSAKEDIKQQDIKQAVVIADNFNDKLVPLTISKPSEKILKGSYDVRTNRCHHSHIVVSFARLLKNFLLRKKADFAFEAVVLLPVVNGVLLDYVLQSLEECGIEETYIFCCAHNQQIRTYISSSRWSETDSSMSVVVISSSTFMSMGDTMRELDSKALIRSDFILLRGDVIFNYPLVDVLEEHKKRRQSDKACALTLLYRKALPNHKTRCKEDDFLVAVESSSQRIRYYQRINNNKSINIPLEVFQENEEVSVHYDLLDAHISICSACVPPLYSDNFDYETLDDFVKGLLVNEELLGNSMYIHIAKSGYGASISNFYMYDAVSQDILSRWTYPLVPDLFSVKGSKYSFSRHNIYKATYVEMGRNCTLKQNIVIGNNTKIGEGCFITNSVIGDNCVIGKNVEIKGSYLWSNVTVGDNCKLDTCLLAKKVTVHNNVTIKPGCILGNDVIIGDDIVLNEFTKLQNQVTVIEEEDSFGEDGFGEQEEVKEKEEESCDINLVGAKGHGFLCRSPCQSDDDEDDDLIVDVWGKLPDDTTFNDETASSSSDIPSEGDLASDGSNGAGGDYDDDTALFYAEVMESLQRGIEEKVKSENLILEINSSKHAYNVTMKEVNTILIKVILKIPLENQEKEPAVQEYLVSIKKNLVFFHPLVSNYIRSVESQLECLSSIEDFMKNNQRLSPAVIKVIHFWYDKDILNEAVILKWYQNISPENEDIKKQVSSFINWLQEADEESSEDE